MKDSTSAQSLIVQLSSLASHLEKISNGSAGIRDIELMSAVNGVLKDCILLQKNMKLKKVKQEMSAGSEVHISDTDHQKLQAYLENIQPSINVDQQRVSRVIGQMSSEGNISAAAVKENIFETFETQKNKLGGNDQEECLELQDLTLISAEAIYEVVRRLIIQESSRL